MKYHKMAPELYAALSSGGSGREALAELVAAQRSKHQLLLLGVAEAAAGHPEAAVARAGFDLLGRVEQQDQDAAAAVITHPSVGAWAYRTLNGLRGREPVPGATPGALAAVAAVAAIRAGVTAEITVPVVGGSVMLPSLGAAGPFDGARAVVRVTAGGAEVSGGGAVVRVRGQARDRARGWRPLTTLLTQAWPRGAPAAWRGERFELVADDVDPFRMPAAPGVVSDLDTASWAAAFRDAWRLLAAGHPGTAAELAALIRVVVPLATPQEGQVSSSSPETFGAIALSRPTDPVTLAVTLAHEVQHVKLSALLDLVQMTVADEGPSRLYAPWREDPRPASGLLQGTYAYLGVTRFWERRLAAVTAPSDTALAEVEFSRWRAAAALGAATLRSSGQLTAAGEQFVAGVAAALADLEGVPVRRAAVERAARENARHRERWLAAHGPVLA